MPSDSFCLAAQARLDSKWLKTDIQLAFTRDGLCGLWNEMVKDGEIVYTGTELTQNGELPPRKGTRWQNTWNLLVPLKVLPWDLTKVSSSASPCPQLSLVCLGGLCSVCFLCKL
uniref:HECT and RLD domain containing E3 ubiquitin protein ligase 2 n=1 Tax=Sus scrofa TaxID=9823 RepID=A0A4X1VSF4_PIG